jgi:SMODS and SLOG-associating 2TM effector domain 1/SMODS and SLOG-associating 2TM effector domain 3
MTEGEMPSLFIDADRTAEKTQKRFLVAIKVVVIGSLVNSGLGLFDDTKPLLHLQAVIGVFILIAACYLLFGKPQKIWYSTRALAESIKTISWKYAMRAEPFSEDRAKSAAKFRETVSKLLRANDEAASLRFASDNADLITEGMDRLREDHLDARRKVYLERRLNDQLTWYRKKSTWNDRRSVAWYLALIILSILALLVSLLRLDQSFTIAIDWVFSFPVAILGWIQVKRYQELASSYSLTAHEIVFIKNEIDQVEAERDFSDFVGNAENAFSREHTQWYARKDLGY